MSLSISSEHAYIWFFSHYYCYEYTQFLLLYTQGALSMLAATLWSFTKPGGRLCLSGMRPHELPAIRGIYSPFVDLSTEETAQESHEIYGDWVRWSVSTKILSTEEKIRVVEGLSGKSAVGL